VQIGCIFTVNNNRLMSKMQKVVGYSNSIKCEADESKGTHIVIA